MALSKSQRDKVERAIAQHEGFRNAYFWHPPSNANGRRHMERKNDWGVGFTHQGVRYEYASNVRCSTRYVYYQGRFYVDGKRATVRKFKALR